MTPVTDLWPQAVIDYYGLRRCVYEMYLLYSNIGSTYPGFCSWNMYINRGI